ncbi:O-antigen ligase family protein [Desulfococcaceae bacterium HSG7]|nr:O-antigen ligase family protein [Desulfococcaceae bacterium HSG7]
MKFLPIIFDRRFLVEVIFILAVGTVTGGVLIKASQMEPKWTKVIILAAIGITGLIITEEREKKLLYLAAFLLPINLTVNPFYMREAFRRPINGFEIRAFDIPFLILMVMWFARIIFNRDEKIYFYLWFTIPYLIVWGLAVASTSRISSHILIKTATLLIVLKNWFIFIYVANNLKDHRTIDNLISVILLSGLIQGLIGVAQHLNGGPLGLAVLGEVQEINLMPGETIIRFGGTIGHPNKLALFLAFMLQINIAKLFIPSEKLKKLLLFIPFSAMSMALILTYSRGAWASLIMGGMINAYICMVKRTQRKVVSAVIVIFVIIIFAVTVVATVPSVSKRIYGDDHGSADIRGPLKVTAKNIIRHHYWLGVGLNNYCSVIKKYDITREAVSWQFPAPVHHEYLLVTAELGVPAGAFFIYLLIYGFYLAASISLSKVEPVFAYLATGFLAGLIGWSFHHTVLYEFTLFTHGLWFYFGILQAMLTMIRTKNDFRTPL